MTDALKAYLEVPAASVFNDDSYYKNHHDGVLDGESFSYIFTKENGWVLFFKTPTVWRVEVYHGTTRGDKSDPYFCDELDQEWLDYQAEVHADDKISEEDLLVALNLITDDQRQEAGAVANASASLNIQRWVSESLHHAQVQLRHEGLLKRIPSLSLKHAGGAMPFQAEGLLEGMPFYFRYRGGYMTLNLGAPDGSGDLFFKPLYSAGMSYGEDLQGWLSDEEFADVFCALVKELKRSDIYWKFPGNFTEDYLRDKKGDPSELGAWGATPQDAWDRLHHHEGNERISSQQWLDYVNMHGLRFETTTIDDRPFPANDPEFTVLD